MKKKQRGAWLPLLIWAGIIFLTSCTRVTRDAFVAALGALMGKKAFSVFWDYTWFIFVKGYHVMEFAVLAALCWWALRTCLRLNNRHALALSMILSLLYAISDEYHQTFVPFRGGRWTDVVIDFGGICFPLLLILHYTRGRRTKGK